MSPRLRPWLLFVLLLALFPALGVAIRWLKGELSGLSGWETVLLLALPVLLWAYLRYFSILACRDACRPPQN